MKKYISDTSYHTSTVGKAILFHVPPLYGNNFCSLPGESSSIYIQEAVKFWTLGQMHFHLVVQHLFYQNVPTKKGQQQYT